MPNHSPDRGTGDGRRLASGYRQGAPPLHATHQFPREVARLLVAGAVRVVRHGRALPAGGGAVRGVESATCGLGGRSLRLALEQRAAHVAGQDDQLVKVAPLLAMIPDWCAFLKSAVPEEELRDIRRHARTGRPSGDESFLARLEGLVGRLLQPQKRGPKPKQADD